MVSHHVVGHPRATHRKSGRGNDLETHASSLTLGLAGTLLGMGALEMEWSASALRIHTLKVGDRPLAISVQSHKCSIEGAQMRLAGPRRGSGQMAGAGEGSFLEEVPLS